MLKEVVLVACQRGKVVVVVEDDAGVAVVKELVAVVAPCFLLALVALVDWKSAKQHNNRGITIDCGDRGRAVWIKEVLRRMSE